MGISKKGKQGKGSNRPTLKTKNASKKGKFGSKSAVSKTGKFGSKSVMASSKKGKSAKSSKRRKQNTKTASTSAMIASINRMQSKTSMRPILKTENVSKKRAHSEDDETFQKKISKKDLRVRGDVPSGNLSLKKEKQIDFKKMSKGIARRHSNLKNVTNYDRPGIICITNLPNGFVEGGLYRYFKQFGDVTNLRLVRSRNTGRSCGYGYVEFKFKEVAIIAAETMDQYLIFGKILKCRLIPYSKITSDKIFSVKKVTPESCPKALSRAAAVKKLNAHRTKNQEQKRQTRVVESFNKKMKKLQALGVNLDLTLETLA